MRFLSPEWAEAFKDALNANEEFRQGIASQSAKLQQVIVGPDGEVRYWLRIEDGSVDMGLGDIEGPDAVITQNYETAADLARGDLSAVSAFMTGKLKVSGNLLALMGLAGPFSQLPEIMEALDVEY